LKGTGTVVFYLKQKFEIGIPFVAHMHLKYAKSANMAQEGQNCPKGQKKEKREKTPHLGELDDFIYL
jgi:hypothetical protein